MKFQNSEELPLLLKRKAVHHSRFRFQGFCSLRLVAIQVEIISPTLLFDLYMEEKRRESEQWWQILEYELAILLTKLFLVISLFLEYFCKALRNKCAQ